MGKLPKYCVKRSSKKEGEYYAHQPSPDMIRLLNIKYKPFKSLHDLCVYAEKQMMLLEDVLRKEKSKLHVDPNTVRGLVHHYYETPYFQNLKDGREKSSKRDYKELLEVGLNFTPRHSNKRLGDTAIKSITREYVDGFHVDLKHSGYSVHRVFHINKVFSRVFNVGIMHSKVISNPFSMRELQVPRANKGKGRGTWSEEQLKLFIKTADELDYSSVGTIALFCNTLAQRHVDIRSLINSNLVDNILTFTQSKSETATRGGGVPVTLDFDLSTLPMLLERLNFVRERELLIKERLDSGETIRRGAGQGNHRRRNCINDHPEGFLINYEGTGTGLTGYNVRAAVQRIRRVAGIPFELQMLDQRASGATRLGLNGLTSDEIMSVTGHRNPKTVRIYLRKESQMRSNALNKVYG